MKNRRTAAPSAMAEPIQTLKEIDEEIARLKERAASIVTAEKAGVIARIKEAIAYYGLTSADLGVGGTAKSSKKGQPAIAAKKAASGKVAETASPTGSSVHGAAIVPAAKKTRAGAGQVKYKDDAGNSWTGFGPKPRWLSDALAAGKALDDLKA